MPQNRRLYKEFILIYGKLETISKIYENSEQQDRLVTVGKIQGDLASEPEVFYNMVNVISKDGKKINFMHSPQSETYAEYKIINFSTVHTPEGSREMGSAVSGTKDDLRELKVEYEKIKSALKKDGEKGKTISEKVIKYCTSRNFGDQYKITQNRIEGQLSFYDSAKSRSEFSYTLLAGDRSIEIRFNKKTRLLQSRNATFRESDDSAPTIGEFGFTNVHYGSDTYKSIKEILAEIKENSTKGSASKKVSGLGAMAAGAFDASRAGSELYGRGEVTVTNPLYKEEEGGIKPEEEGGIKPEEDDGIEPTLPNSTVTVTRSQGNGGALKLDLAQDPKGGSRA